MKKLLLFILILSACKTKPKLSGIIYHMIAKDYAGNHYPIICKDSLEYERLEMNDKGDTVIIWVDDSNDCGKSGIDIREDIGDTASDPRVLIWDYTSDSLHMWKKDTTKKRSLDTVIIQYSGQSNSGGQIVNN